MKTTKDTYSTISRDESKFLSWTRKKQFKIISEDVKKTDFHFYLVDFHKKDRVSISFSTKNVICNRVIEEGASFRLINIYSGHSWDDCHKILEYQFN